jgi:aspartate/methionine/tyrosine aminotransferase
MSQTPGNLTGIRIPPRVADIAIAQFDVLNTRAAELRAAGHRVVSLGQALPGFGPPASAIAAAHKALATPEAHIYSADAGIIGLREALCERLAAGSRGRPEADGPRADNVIVTAGGNQAFMLALMTLVDPGDQVLLPAPYFVNHEMAIAAFGAVPTEVPLDEARGFALRWADLEPHVTSRTRAVVICTPSNPTGAVIDRTEMTRIVQELGQRGVVLLSDETYGAFVYAEDAGNSSAPGHAEQNVPVPRKTWHSPSALEVPGWRENVVVLNTFSKSFGMTGWRVGYMVADTRVCEQAIKIQDAMIICAPVVSQMGVEAAIRESWEYPLAFHDELIARRQLLIDGLARIPQLHWTPTGGGFFAFVRVKGCTDSAHLANDILEQADVVTIPGSTFGRRGEGFIRLSYSAVSREELQEALERLGRFFRAAVGGC